MSRKIPPTNKPNDLNCLRVAGTLAAPIFSIQDKFFPPIDVLLQRLLFRFVQDEVLENQGYTVTKDGDEAEA